MYRRYVRGIAGNQNIFIGLLLAVLMFSVSFVVYVGVGGIARLEQARDLGRAVLSNTYNPWNTTLTSLSLNAVSAVIWDYRGLDTVIETMVLLAAIIGASHVLGERREPSQRSQGFIAGLSTMAVVLITATIALSIAVHGHLSPGGGFQAGSMFTVLIVLAIPIYTSRILDKLNIKREVLPKIRHIALLLLVTIAVYPLAFMAFGTYAYILQNQAKVNSGFSMPSWFVDTPLAGSVFFFNMIEMIAVSVGLIYATLLLAEYSLAKTTPRNEKDAER